MNNIELPTKKNEKSTTPHVFDSSLSSQEKYRTFNEEVNQPHLRMKKKFDLTEGIILTSKNLWSSTCPYSQTH